MFLPLTFRYMAGTPQFIGIELDISDSGREGCAVSTLTITAEPRDWKEATTIGVQVGYMKGGGGKWEEAGLEGRGGR